MKSIPHDSYIISGIYEYMNTCMCTVCTRWYHAPTCVQHQYTPVAKRDDTDGTTVVFKGKAPVDSACTQKLHKVFLICLYKKSSLIVCSKLLWKL